MSIVLIFGSGHLAVAFSPHFYEPEAAPWWYKGGGAEELRSPTSTPPHSDIDSQVNMNYLSARRVRLLSSLYMRV